MIVAIAFGGWMLVRSPWPERLAGGAWEGAVAATAHLGLRIDEVLVVGRLETSRQQVMEALRLRRGAPILAVDIHAARQRLLTLPWVRMAAVERLLPSTVLVRITERRPLALWQHQGKFALIDEGGVITERNLGQYANLLVVVGTDAPAHAAALLEVLRQHPTLMERVQAAVRVGGRRWNLRLAGGIDVRLPEDDAGAAWTRLAEYHRVHDILGRDIKVLDLRFPDQVIVRRATPSGEEPSRHGRDT
jgi:cell division protein FtsQ